MDRKPFNKPFRKNNDSENGRSSWQNAVPKPNENLVIGPRAIEEAIKAGRSIDKILVQKELAGAAAQEVLTHAAELKIPVQKVPVEKLNRETRGNHQGIIAFVAPISYVSLADMVEKAGEGDEPGLLLILDRVTDVRNLGAIARTAECAGVKGIIVPAQGSAQINADAMKSSAGALNHVPVAKEANLVDSIMYLQASGYTVVACSEKTGDWIYKADYSGPVAIVMGSEEDGISPTLLKRVDGVVAIPMAGQIGSLNVSVATAVILYEAVRQRKGQ